MSLTTGTWIKSFVAAFIFRAKLSGSQVRHFSPKSEMHIFLYLERERETQTPFLLKSILKDKKEISSVFTTKTLSNVCLLSLLTCPIRKFILIQISFSFASFVPKGVGLGRVREFQTLLSFEYVEHHGNNQTQS